METHGKQFVRFKNNLYMTLNSNVDATIDLIDALSGNQRFGYQLM